MTPLPLFAVSAAGLVALALLAMLRPWRGHGRGRAGAPADRAGREALRRALYLDQRDELHRARATGLLDAADAAEAEAELQRRLLEDLPAEDARPGPDAASGEARRAARSAGAPAPGADLTPWVLGVVVPVLAVAGYLWRGTPAGLVAGPAGAGSGVVAQVTEPSAATGGRAGAPTASRPAAAPPGMAAAMAAMPGTLSASAPSDPAGWARLARAYRVLGQAALARQAFERVGPGLWRDPTMLAEYADTLAATNRGRADAAVTAALDAALRQDPDNAMALSLAATLAWNAGDAAGAARQWRHLLRVLPAGAREAGTVRGYLARAEARDGATSGADPAAPAASVTSATSETSPAATLASAPAPASRARR